MARGYHPGWGKASNNINYYELETNCLQSLFSVCAGTCKGLEIQEMTLLINCLVKFLYLITQICVWKNCVFFFSGIKDFVMIVHGSENEIR